MDVENVEASGSVPNVAGDACGDSMVTDGNETPASATGAAGLAQERVKRKAKRIVRQNSRENVASGKYLLLARKMKSILNENNVDR